MDSRTSEVFYDLLLHCIHRRAIFRSENEGSKMAVKVKQHEEGLRVGNLESKRDELKKNLDKLLAEKTDREE